MRLKLNLNLLVSFILLFLFFIYFSTKINLPEIWQLIRSGIWYYFFLALLAGILMTYFQVYLIHQTFQLIGSKISFIKSLKTWLMMVAAGVITLGIAGPVIIYNLARRDQELKNATKTTFLFYFFYLSPIILLIVITAFWLFQPAFFNFNESRSLFFLTLIIFAAGAIWFLSRWLNKFIEKVTYKLNHQKEKVHIFSRIKITDFIKTFFISIINLIFNFLVLIFILNAFQINESLAIAIKNLALIEFVSLFSPSGSGIGFVEIGMSSLLILSKVTASKAVAVVVFYRLIIFWLPFIIGSIILSHQWSNLIPNLKKQQRNFTLKVCR